MDKDSCEAQGGELKKGTCICKEEEGGVTKPLKSGNFADVCIVPIINALNSKGCPTVASCSGTAADHHGHIEGSYLSVEMPEDVVKPGFGRTAHDVWPENIKKPKVVKCFLDAGKRANWLSELSLYMLFDPTVRYALPKTKSVATDEKAESQPEVVAAEKKLHDVMHGQHSSAEFLKALDERDSLRQKAYERFGIEAYNDEKIMQAWVRLQTEVSKCCPLLKGP